VARAGNFWVHAAMAWLENRDTPGPDESPSPATTTAARSPAPAPGRAFTASPALAGGESWRGRAACRRVDPDLFFPVGTSGPALDQVTRAKRLCLACPVRRPCLDWALRNGIQFGIWGGLTEDERGTLRRTFATLNDHSAHGGQAEQAG
jgi:WhiB family transcriptional regulator, redox-sensing transcriptional regulator